MTQRHSSIRFTIYKGNKLMTRETLSQPIVKLGRLSSSHVRLDDPLVSRMHAIIELGDQGVTLTDLGSAQGTELNGERINRGSLKSGDTIAIGDLRLVVELDPKAQAEPEQAKPVQVETAAGSRPIPKAPNPGAVAAPPALPTTQVVPAPRPAATPVEVKATKPVVTATPIPAPQGAMRGQTPTDARTHVVEVAAMFDNSIVDVKHVSARPKDSRKRLTVALLSCAALLLMASAYGFAKGIFNAGANDAALTQWLEYKLPVETFEAANISGAYSALAFGGLVFGLGFLVLGLWRRKEDSVSSAQYAVGKSVAADFACDIPGEMDCGDEFALVSQKGDNYELNLAPHMTANVLLDGQTETIAGHNFTIPLGARIHVDAGAHAFAISTTEQPRRHKVPLFAGMSAALGLFFAGSFALHMGMWGVMQHVYDDSDAVVGGSFDDDDLMIAAADKPEEDVLPETEPTNASDPASGESGKASGGDAGKLGDPNETSTAAKRIAVKDRNMTPAMARKAAVAAALESGIFSAGSDFGFSQDSHTMFSSGDDAQDLYGGFDGPPGSSHGFGTTYNGVGPGGGDYGPGTIGPGDYGKFMGPGDYDKFKPGLCKGAHCGKCLKRTADGKCRKSTGPIASSGDIINEGDGLDPSIVRRYLRRREARYRHCYERELMVKPNLQGTVVTRFTIGPSGSVLVANAKGVHANVSGCVREQIRTIRFPKPTDGTLVNVTYPINFNH